MRPFIYRLANQLALEGSVMNAGGAVVVEIQGDHDALEDFGELLLSQLPPLAKVQSATRNELPTDPDIGGFIIDRSSDAQLLKRDVTPDAAVCPQCLAEMRDSDDRRRYDYVMLNCTVCGPRFSIIRDVPYDRKNTTMASFEMCDDCAREYNDPTDRRFHAQPTCCRKCGPTLQWKPTTAAGTLTGPPVRVAADVLRQGGIIAIKGLGGYHLATRADLREGVARLVATKKRKGKPLAIMVASAQVAERYIDLSDHGLVELCSPAAPIVIAPRKEKVRVAPDVAPNCHTLGVMIAHTPLQHRLFDALGGTPLVMTSANDGDEPIVYDDNDAFETLAPMCDGILWHDREIARPVDDSVVLQVSATMQPIRRSRGYVPIPIELPYKTEKPGLCVGAEMKCTAAVVRDDEAILSQHLGNLTRAGSYHHFGRIIQDLQKLFAVKPEWIAHDLHPAYISTQYAKRLAEETGVQLIGVQHHHAHAAAVLAEHNIKHEVLAIVCDGAGYGIDGTIWGGEIMVADLCNFKRVAHLQPFPLPGGDACSLQPWRTALALQHLLNVPPVSPPPVPEQDRVMINDMLTTKTNCALTSSTGRLFDAVASILGVCHINNYDAQAPMMLESLAAESDDERIWNIDELSPTKLIRAILKDLRTPKTTVRASARRFHRTLADMFAQATAREAMTRDIGDVVISGGVMCNALFGGDLEATLTSRGLNVLKHQHVPANDGGISYGQAAVATARLAQQKLGG